MFEEELKRFLVEVVTKALGHVREAKTSADEPALGGQNYHLMTIKEAAEIWF